MTAETGRPTGKDNERLRMLRYTGDLHKFTLSQFWFRPLALLPTHSFLHGLTINIQSLATLIGYEMK